MVEKQRQEEFENTKEVPRIRKSKKDRQHNGQKKQENNDLQSITHKTKDRATGTPLKIGCSGRVSSSYTTSGTREGFLCKGQAVSDVLFVLFCTIHHLYEQHFATSKHSKTYQLNYIRTQGSTHKTQLALRFYVYNHSCIVVNIRYWDKPWSLFNVR